MPVSVCNFIRNPGSGGKFVVLLPLSGEDGGIMVFSDFSRDSQHRDIAGRWESGQGTSLSGAGLRVAGGGWWRLEASGVLVLYGRSAAYGGFDSEWVRDRLRPGMVLNEQRVDVI